MEDPTPEQFSEWLKQGLDKYNEDWGDAPAFRERGPKLPIVAQEVARLAYQAGAAAERRTRLDRWMAR
jgi:hypothetical protein